MNSNYKKISEAEMIIGLSFATLIYFFCFILDSFVIGIILSPVIQSFFTFGTWFLFKSHGDPHASNLGANLAQYGANLIPFIPATIAAFAIKIFIHNHQQIASVAGKVI